MDMVVVIPSDPDKVGWKMDIDVDNDGNALTLDSEDEARMQRASLAAIMVKGTIPAAETLGADWGAYVAGNMSLLEIDNQIKGNMEKWAGASTIASTPVPLYTPSDEGMGINVVGIDQNPPSFNNKGI